MPKKSLIHARAAACQRQSGRCFYCGVLMCLDDAAAFADRHGLPLGVAKLLRCTAEHLRARRDGGRDAAANIAAACWLCNKRRHARKQPPAPEVYLTLVRKRVSRGRWHDPTVFERGLVEV